MNQLLFKRLCMSQRAKINKVWDIFYYEFKNQITISSSSMVGHNIEHILRQTTADQLDDDLKEKIK